MSDAGTGPVRLEVIALDGIPEVHPGDDLAGLVGDALERTEGALPLWAASARPMTHRSRSGLAVR